MGKTCQICGKPSGMYPLCKTHLTMKADGEVIKCENCNTWFEIKKGCSNCKKEETVKYEKTIAPWTKTTKDSKEEKREPDELTCIICGNLSNGKHFCLDCYRKYKDRAIDIRIINCKETEILDAYGNLQYKCDDGRKVRSKSEKIISDFLFKYGIRTIYEKTVYYYPNENETITLHPDFYLPDYDYYIEHNGVDTKSYKANKAKTEEMYKALGYKVIVTTESDLGDIEAKLKPVLRIN